MTNTNYLSPKQIIRLSALGLLLEQEMTYNHLALELRIFVGSVMGNNLDFLGSSLEMMRLEELIKKNHETFTLTSSGKVFFENLMTRPLQKPFSDIAKFHVLCKLRFMQFLTQPQQIDMSDDMKEFMMLEKKRIQYAIEQAKSSTIKFFYKGEEALIDHYIRHPFFDKNY